jgi:hypothetical protein
MANKEVPMFKLDVVGVKKICIGALIAGGGAALTYFVEAIPGIDLGQMTPVIVSVASIVINAARKWLLKYKTE